MVSDLYFLALTRANDDGERWPAIRRRAGSHHFRTGLNISSFDRNATPVEPDNESARPGGVHEIYLVISMACGAQSRPRSSRMMSTIRMTPPSPIPEWPMP